MPRLPSLVLTVLLLAMVAVVISIVVDLLGQGAAVWTAMFAAAGG
jgi:hypothetical protein